VGGGHELIIKFKKRVEIILELLILDTTIIECKHRYKKRYKIFKILIWVIFFILLAPKVI